MNIKLYIGETFWREVESAGGFLQAGCFYDHSNGEGGRLRMLFAKDSLGRFNLIKVYPEGYKDPNVQAMIEAKIGFVNDKED
jgi:hypothetical protein